jgi:hypothetical protein
MNPDAAAGQPPPRHGIARRSVLRSLGTGALAAGAGGALAACTAATKLIKASGHKPADGGAYTDGTTDYTSMISTFKAADAQYLSNCPLPPGFNVFWKQAHQQGSRPRLATFTSGVSGPPNKQEVAQRAAQGELQRDVRAAQLRQRPGAGRGHHRPGRRAVEGEHRQISLRDENRRYLAEQSREDRRQPRADECMMMPGRIGEEPTCHRAAAATVLLPRCRTPTGETGRKEVGAGVAIQSRGYPRQTVARDQTLVAPYTPYATSVTSRPPVM